MAAFIATTVQWVILPMIMCAIFAFAWIIACSARTAELRVSSWAGFWAGLLTFVVYVVSQLSQIQEPKLAFAALPGVQFLELGWGLTTGFVFLWVVRHAVPTRLVGLLTLMLASSSTSGAVHVRFHQQPACLRPLLDARHRPGNSPAHRALPYVHIPHFSVHGKEGIAP